MAAPTGKRTDVLTLVVTGSLDNHALSFNSMPEEKIISAGCQSNFNLGV